MSFFRSEKMNTHNTRFSPHSLGYNHPSTIQRTSATSSESKQKFCFSIVKPVLIIANIIQIVMSVSFLVGWLSNAGKLTDVDRNLTILSRIMAIILSFMGLIGTLSENIGCLVAYTGVLYLMTISISISKQIWHPQRIVNMILILSSATLSLLFVVLLRRKRIWHSTSESEDASTPQIASSPHCTSSTL
jgi:hypothetical protein